MNREVRIGLAIVVALGLLVFGLLTVGSLGGLNPELRQYAVEDVLSGPDRVARFGTEEIRIVGWYAELAADCVGDAGAADDAVAWLDRTCPLRVLMPDQPALTVTQADLEAAGLRLAAPNGKPFPSRAQPTGPNLRLEQLVYVGHFDDSAAAQCPEALRTVCRETFVVNDYSGLIR
jgi:hypothetical protein